MSPESIGISLFRIRLLRRIALLALALLSSGGAAAESDPAAVELLRKSEQLMRGSGTEGIYRVEIVRPEWQRTLRLKSIDDALNDRYRLEMLKPRKVKGTVFLKLDDRLSMYLPKLRRNIAISPAMMHDPWMGSDFNNQDLLESSALLESYEHRIIGREGAGERAVITIESTPKPDSAVSWLRLEQRIRTDGLPLEIRYHCRQDQRKRVLRFEQPRQMDGRVIPTRWIMQPLALPDQRTVIEVEEIRFGVRPDAALFEVGAPPEKDRDR